MILWLLSCAANQAGEQHVVEVVCEPETIDYESTAEPFLQNYCTGCHSSHLESGLRFGAPETVDLDSYASAQEWAERSFYRISIDGDMPPGGGISPEEKDRFAQWALCGTKGSSVERYATTHSPRHQSHALATSVRESDIGIDVFELQRFIELGGMDHSRFGTYSSEYYQLHSNGANFLGYTLYSAPDTVVQEVFYDPPLPILQLEESEQDIEVLATIWRDGEAIQEWQEWSGSQAYPSWMDIDSHEREEEPLQSVWLSDNGEERGWHFSQQILLSSQWWYRSDGYYIEIQQFSGVDSPEPRSYFEINATDDWFELMLEEGSP